MSADVAQLVERVHGKDEVPSSILGIGSKRKPATPVFLCASEGMWSQVTKLVRERGDLS